MSDEERDLRDALRARGAEVPVGRADEPGLVRRLAAARRRRQQTRLTAAAAALVVVLSAATLVAANDGEPSNLVAGPGPSSPSTGEASSTTPATTAPVETSTVPPATTTTTVSATSSTAPTTVPRTTTAAAPLPPVPEDALWPAPGTATTFASPEQAASDFARRFLGMATPQLARSSISGADATITVRPLPTASITTILALRRVEVRGWVVVGCAAPSIVVEQPTSDATISSPLTVSGQAQAFEGHVDVEVRRDGSTTPLGRSFGTGASDMKDPFEATVTFTRSSVPRGTVVVSEPRVDDGTKGPLAATVVRVRF